MSRTTLIVWGASAMMSAVVTAQAPQTAPPQSPQPLTLTGCLRAWDASSMGAPPAASAGTPPLVLTGAERLAPSGAPASAVPSTAQLPPRADTPCLRAHSTYLLKPAADAVRLSAYVDRQVEVTGTLVPDAAAATPEARPAPSTTAARDGAAPASMPVSFTVSAVRTLETSCPAR